MDGPVMCAETIGVVLSHGRDSCEGTHVQPHGVEKLFHVWREHVQSHDMEELFHVWIEHMSSSMMWERLSYE